MSRWRVGTSTGGPPVAKSAIMLAQLISHFQDSTPDSSLIELVIWRVPRPVPPSIRSYNCRAAYVVNGQRIVGFDNERGKGDHCHLGGRDVPYHFTTVARLVEDFIAAVSARRTT